MRLLLFLCLITLAYNCPAQTPGKTFEEANKLYEASEYSAAEKKYKLLFDQGLSSKELYFNYANTAFKLNKKAEAVLYYEKAILLSPGDKNLKQNLTIARESIDTEIIDIPDFMPVRIWKAISSALSPLLWLLILALLVCFTLYSFYQWRINLNSNKKLKGFYSFIIGFALFLIGFFAYKTSYKLLHQRTDGIVMSNTILKSAPDERSEDLKSLSEGVKIKIQNKIDDWVKVSLSNKEEGWIQLESIEMI